MAFCGRAPEIFFRRLNGIAGELTNDPVLQGFKFTNAYRASGPGQPIPNKNVIYRDDLPSDETNVFFRILLFKLFNKIETWTTLEKEVGPITWETLSFAGAYDAVLAREMTYGTAYTPRHNNAVGWWVLRSSGKASKPSPHAGTRRPGAIPSAPARHKVYG